MKAINIQEVAELSAAINPTWRPQAAVTTGTTTPSPVAGRRTTVVFPVAPGVGNSIAVNVNGVTISSTYTAPGIAGFGAISDLVRAEPGVFACVLKASATYEFWRCVDPTGTVVTTDQTGIGFEIVFEEGEASAVSLTTGSVPAGTVTADTTEGVSVASALRALVHLPVGDVRATEQINTDQIRLTANGSYRAAAGNAITFTVVVAGLLTPLSVVVAGTAITLNLETDGAGAALTTSLEGLQLLQRSEAVLALVDVEMGSGYVGAQVLAAEGATNLATGAAGSVNGDLWAMLDDETEDGAGNHWVLVTPSAISGALTEDTVARVDVSEYAYLYWQTTALTGGYTPRIGLCGGAQ